MPGLPSRPDLDQLRRQTRELLRAAEAGEPAAITRIHVVSPQLTLSAAQLALAREYGFRSWPALRAEAEIRRLELTGQDGTATRLLPSARGAARAGAVSPVTGNPAERDLARSVRSMMWIWLGTPVWNREAYAREACASLLARMAQARQEGTLEPASGLPDQVARLCAALAGEGPADGLPAPWAGMLAAAGQLDGPRHRLGIGLTVPPVEGVTIQLDALTCAPYRWRLHLRSAGRWPVEIRRDGSGNLTEKWRSMQFSADDDRGNSYIGNAGAFSSGDGGIERSTVEFRTRLDPLARRLTLTFAGSADQVTIDLELSTDLHAGQ